MTRRRIGTLTKCAVVLVGACLLAVAQAADPPTHYISPSGNDDTGDGSEVNPWATLAFACAQIDPTVGAHIICFSGEYAITEQANLMLDMSVQPEFSLELHPNATGNATFDATGSSGVQCILSVRYDPDESVEPTSSEEYGVTTCAIRGIDENKKLVFKNVYGTPASGGIARPGLVKMTFIGNRTLQWCEFCNTNGYLVGTKNTLPDSGYWDPDSDRLESDVVIQNCVFESSNDETETAVYIDDAMRPISTLDRPTTGTIEQSVFRGLHRDDPYTPSYAIEGPPRMTVSDCNFHGNNIDYIDKVISESTEGGPPEFIGCLFEGTDVYNMMLVAGVRITSCEFRDYNLKANFLGRPWLDVNWPDPGPPPYETADSFYDVVKCNFSGTANNLLETTKAGWDVLERRMFVTLKRCYFAGTYRKPVLSQQPTTWEPGSSLPDDATALSEYEVHSCVFRGFDLAPISDANAATVILDNCTIAEGTYGLLFGHTPDDPCDFIIRNNVIDASEYAVRAENGVTYPDDFHVRHNMYIGPLTDDGQPGSNAYLDPDPDVNDLSAETLEAAGIDITPHPQDPTGPFVSYLPVDGGDCTGTGTSDSNAIVSMDNTEWHTEGDGLLDRGAYSNECGTGSGSGLPLALVVLGLCAVRRRS